MCDCLQQCIEGIWACQELSEMIPELIDLSLTPLPTSSLPPVLTGPIVMKNGGKKLSQWSSKLEDELQVATKLSKEMERNEFFFVARLELILNCSLINITIIIINES